MASSDSGQRVLQVPELLYHTVLTVIDYQADPNGGIQYIYVLGTHGSLQTAKVFTQTSLEEIGYKKYDFINYDVRDLGATSPENWKYGDGVYVHATAPAGHVFIVRIDTTPNNESIPMTADGKIVLPDGASFLHYVVQRVIDYNADRNGSIQWYEIEGTYVHRADAWTAAHKCLDRSLYAEYDSRGDPDFIEEWPYGEDVAVHAVSETGQNCIVSVVVPVSRQEHERSGVFEEATKKQVREQHTASAVRV
ncbi:hypothetical protein S7711_03804 [Stachybotrys chartarum IBT 7711]|uniref:Uncharacterized protein n=1 Tax=Stachybotrys chartarum (strain CBS 109288 / IBT 7711) TaxID=1280523 RepID=A0A084AU89_STACB|nr:hypothetical protein S7711_03804 [Stachybotrys chartarum IBT 7711]KFA46910.1 hypothetical protein S40293_03624 [Stachybotrys chartarum IBT 40293]